MSLRFLFLVTVLLGSVAVPLTGEPQGAKKVWRIGVLWHAGGPEEEAPFLGAFRDGLREACSVLRPPTGRERLDADPLSADPRIAEEEAKDAHAALADLG